MRHFSRATLSLAMAVAALATAALPAQAQLRPGQPPVLDAPPPPPPAAIPNFAAEFRARYTAAGAPRLMLFWNVELSDQIHQDIVVHDHDTTTSSEHAEALRQVTPGWGGNSKTAESNAQAQIQRQREIVVGQREDPKRVIMLSPRDAVQFERAFDAEMRNSGALLVDRVMAVRATAVEKGKASESLRKLEAEAVRGKADLLLQVLFIADDQAPIGYGFDVSVRDVATGAVVTSFYTRAVPQSPSVQTGYIATDHGFQRQSTPQGRTPPEEIAVVLADDVMNQLGPVLPARTESHRKPK